MSNVINFNRNQSKDYINVYLLNNTIVRLPVTETSLEELRKKLDRNKLTHIMTGEVYINAAHITTIDFKPEN